MGAAQRDARVPRAPGFQGVVARGRRRDTRPASRNARRSLRPRRAAPQRGCDFRSAVRRVERGIAYYADAERPLAANDRVAAGLVLHDRMVESVLSHLEDAATLFEQGAPRPLLTIDVLGGGRAELVRANTAHGFALA